MKGILGLSALTLVVLLMTLSNNNVESRAASHFCTRLEVYRYYWYERYCSHRWGWCTCYQWRRRWRTATRVRQICCPGWKSCYCNVPICNPPCGSKGYCIWKDKCECSAGYTGSRCNVEKCTADKNCFPGTCHGGQCQCAGGFEGGNCIEVRDGPEHTKCQVRFMGQELGKEVEQAKFKCTSDTYDDREVVNYIHGRDFTKLILDWETTYNLNDDDFPHRPQWLSDYGLGIAGQRATVRMLKSDNSSAVPLTGIACHSPATSRVPHLISECKNVNFPWSSGIGHNFLMEIKMYAKTGGFKKLFDTQRGVFIFQDYQGQELYQKILIKFDVKDPYHCIELTPNNCTSVLEVPIGIPSGKTRSLKLLLVSFNWVDVDSGVLNYDFEVYQLSYNKMTNSLEEPSTPVYTKTNWTSMEKFPVAEVKEAGIHSVRVKVYDAAGNVAQARTNVIVDPSSRITTVKTDPPTFRIKSANSNSSYAWFTSDPGTELVVTWTGYFINAIHVQKHMLAAVAPLNLGSNVKLLEDTWSNRSNDAVPNDNGITSFSYAFEQGRGITTLTDSNSWTNLTDVTGTVKIPVTPMRDGDSVKVWVRATDMMGETLIDTTAAHYDSSPPELTKITFMGDSSDGPYPFSSRVAVEVNDEHSGMGEFFFTVRDTKDNKEIISETQAAQQAADTSKCGVNKPCHCVDMGACFDLVHSIYLDNCKLKGRVGRQFKINVEARNQAQLVDIKQMTTKKLTELSGLDSYPTVVNFTVHSTDPTNLIISWLKPESCYKIQNIIISYDSKDGKKERHMSETNSTTLSDLYGGSTVSISIYILYDNGEQSAANTQEVITDAEPGIGTGAIIAIIIFVILLFLLAILVCFMMVRWRRGKRPLPFRFCPLPPSKVFGPAGQNQEAVFTPGAPLNNLKNEELTLRYDNPGLVMDKAKSGQLHYTEDPDDPDGIYYGDVEFDGRKIDQSRIRMEERVNGGRFADIWRGILNDKNSKEIVAIKKLKKGASDDDKRLMQAKINYYKENIPRHDNIVNFVGAVMNDDLSGPMMVMEYCTDSLKEWLSRNKGMQLDGNTEELLISFSSDIAKGVEGLHRHSILHRRLAARNVLLSELPGKGLVAKVTGFGPLKGEENQGRTGTQPERKPIKWMAPESLDGTEGEQTTYSVATDVWSYGIVLWEIFSLGMTPYEDIRGHLVLETHRSGYKLPKPDLCQDFMYDEVMLKCWSLEPSDRPTMDEVKQSIMHQYQGGEPGSKDAYYYS